MKCKCGSENFFTKRQRHGDNVDLYCEECGKWQKWLTKDELRVFEHNENEISKMKENLAEFISILDYQIDYNSTLSDDVKTAYVKVANSVSAILEGKKYNEY